MEGAKAGGAWEGGLFHQDMVQTVLEECSAKTVGAFVCAMKAAQTGYRSRLGILHAYGYGTGHVS